MDQLKNLRVISGNFMIKFGSYLISKIKIDFKIFSYSEIEELIKSYGGFLKVYGGLYLYRTKNRKRLGFVRGPSIRSGVLITSSLKRLINETKPNNTNQGYSTVYFTSRSQAEKMQELMSFDMDKLEKCESCPNFILVKP